MLDVKNVFAAEVDENNGESILWAHSPVRLLYISSRTGILFVFAFLSVSFIYYLTEFKYNIFYSSFLGLMALRVINLIWESMNIVYCITNKRIIISYPNILFSYNGFSLKPNFVSIYHADIHFVKSHAIYDTFGDIYFNLNSSIDGKMLFGKRIGFELTPDNKSRIYKQETRDTTGFLRPYFGIKWSWRNAMFGVPDQPKAVELIKNLVSNRFS